MPTEVQRRPSEPLPVGPRPGTTPPIDHFAATKAQQQHREALRLALGSILTPVSKPCTRTNEESLNSVRLLRLVFPNGKKRPPNSISRSSSGTASPAYPSPFGLPGSGAHTPVGTPPTSSPYFTGHGPNSSEYLLHPHHAYQHHGHPHPPSKLGRSASNSNSPSESAHTTAPSSSHPSPLPDTGAAIESTTGLPPLPDLEPLPPAMSCPQQQESSTESAPAGNGTARPVRPSISPLTPRKAEESVVGVAMEGVAATDHAGVEGIKNEGAAQSGRGTPRAKFLQTLQGKSAWDALIHGSFT